MLTMEEVTEYIKECFIKASLDPENCSLIVNGDIQHNRLGVPYVTCGTYRILRFDGYGLDNLGEGVTKFDAISRVVNDSTNAKATERRFIEITYAVFSVLNINLLARTKGISPMEVLEVYTSYAIEDFLWQYEHFNRKG